MSAELDADVCIVGAGIAGLTAARILHGSGASVVVVEARDRVGGRTHSVESGGAAFDLGGQWLGPAQHRMAQLVKDFAIETFPTFHEGRKVLLLGDRRSTYRHTIPKMSPLKLASLQRGLRRIESMARAVPTAIPWGADEAAALDAESVEGWKRRLMRSPDVRGVVDVAIRTVFGAEPAEVSLLYALAYMNAGGGLMKLVEVAGGAQETRFVGGAQQVALRIASDLGERVRLDSPVRAIAHDADGVTVRAQGGDLRARLAIVAVPPALAGRIEYDPAMPADRDELTQRFPMGATIKCHLVYDEPFWRDAGLSGEAVLTERPVSAVFDNTSADGSRQALLAFVVGRHAHALGAFAASERRTAVVRSLVHCFGPQAAEPSDYLEKDWSADPWSRGCPTGFMPPGVLSAYGSSLRAPVGRIHWAGTETATEWTGYMEGAAQSGERAAAEALARLA